jgi:hypothetical protein
LLRPYLTGIYLLINHIREDMAIEGGHDSIVKERFVASRRFVDGIMSSRTHVQFVASKQNPQLFPAVIYPLIGFGKFDLHGTVILFSTVSTCFTNGLILVVTVKL